MRKHGVTRTKKDGGHFIAAGTGDGSKPGKDSLISAQAASKEVRTDQLLSSAGKSTKAAPHCGLRGAGSFFRPVKERVRRGLSREEFRAFTRKYLRPDPPPGLPDNRWKLGLHRMPRKIRRVRFLVGNGIYRPSSR